MTPLMDSLRASVVKEVEEVSRKLTYLQRDRQMTNYCNNGVIHVEFGQEELTFYGMFIPENDIPKLFDVDRTYPERVECNTEYLYTIPHLLDPKYKNPPTEQINHGILVMDFTHTEDSGHCMLIMTGEGLKALEETNPLIYGVLNPPSLESERKLIDYSKFDEADNIFCWKIFWCAGGHEEWYIDLWGDRLTLDIDPIGPDNIRPLVDLLLEELTADQLL